MNYRFDDDGNVLPPIPKSIYEINNYIKGLIEEEAQLQEIYAVGEISNFKKHSSGHFYLTLKDDKSEIRAVMFRSYAQRVRFKPQDGMRVIVSGRIGVYSQAGGYQLYIESMQPDGIGSLHLAFEQLKAKMNEEGLFDDAHKKPIPKYPNTIGVITSPTGAAVKDIIKVATRRYPCAKIVVFPSLVQGTDAPSELIKGIEYFNIMNSVDVIIIGRGGGSMEDLWAFNDERLARAIFRSHIPVISAVGHEIDFTICDFVSDVRAATPSHAAELATPNIEEIAYRLNEFSQRALDSIINTVEAYRVRLDDLASSRVLVKPLTLLDIPNLKLAGATDKLYKAFQDRIKQDREKFIQLNAKLLALNPMSVLNRGYGAICDSENRVISTVNSVEINDNINIMLSDGRISATVTKKERREKNG